MDSKDIQKTPEKSSEDQNSGNSQGTALAHSSAATPLSTPIGATPSSAKPDPDEGCIEGYLLNYSAVEGNNPRIEFMIQAKETAKRVRCFSPSPQKRKLVEDLLLSPVKMSKLRPSEKTGDLIMNYETELVADERTLDYPPLDMDNLQLKDVAKCAHESLVTVIGKVTKMNQVANKGGLKYQVLYVKDEIHAMKLMLYGTDVGSCELNETYTFSKFRVKLDKYSYSVFLASAKDISSISKTKNIKSVCADDVGSSWQKPDDTVLQGDLMGVSRITRFILCGRCNKKIQSSNGLYDCQNCKQTMKLKFCKKRVVVSVTFVVEGEDRQQELSVFSDVLDLFLKTEAYAMEDQQINKGLLADGTLKIAVSDKNVVKSMEFV